MEDLHECPMLDLSTHQLISVTPLLMFVTKGTHYLEQLGGLAEGMAGGTAWDLTAVSIN